MSQHPEFTGAGAEPGILVYRIMDFAPVKQEYDQKQKQIELYGGDSYVILHTYRAGSGLLHNLYFWLGETSTTDERGTAAVKAVELDDSLGGLPVQHREVQYYESPLFLSLFPNGITYLDGGVDSGFHHVEQRADIRLF